MPDAIPQKSPAANPPAATPPPADLTGQTAGDFQILRRIGSGGMGQVYLARQLSLKREVALKFLRHDLTTNATALKRFQAEAEAVARLNHPNIVQVYSQGEHAGMRYMALEYVEGRNLRDYLDRKGPPDLPVTLSIMRQVSAALDKAHEQGIVHRDIKPENILVTRKVAVKVADFGLSRVFAGEGLNITQSGVTLGTPLYLSPEQAQGHAVDHRSDVYSFGVTCYHLLAGEPPFTGTTAVEVALKHITDSPRPLLTLRPDLPPDLCAMIHKMMAKDPNERYQSAREVVRDLAKVREGLALGLPGSVSLSVSMPVPLGAGFTTGALNPSQNGAPSPVRRVRWGRWLLAAFVVACAAAAGGVGYMLFHPPAEPPPAQPIPPTVGLPDVRLSERLTTARERELLALVNSHGTKGEERIAVSVELGLLYVREAGEAAPPVREKLLDEARTRFEALEKEQLGRPAANNEAQVIGKLGQAVVLAHRDRPAESNQLFQNAVATVFPKKDVKKDSPAAVLAVQALMLRFPDLGQAVADALTRNAANMAPTGKLPQILQDLKTPRGMAKKE